MEFEAGELSCALELLSSAGLVALDFESTAFFGGVAASEEFEVGELSCALEFLFSAGLVALDFESTALPALKLASPTGWATIAALAGGVVPGEVFAISTPPGCGPPKRTGPWSVAVVSGPLDIIPAIFPNTSR